MDSKTIEVFTAGCAICKETMEMVWKVAGRDHEIHVHYMRDEAVASRAKQLGIRSLPAVIVNGKLAGCSRRGLDEHVLREALR